MAGKVKRNVPGRVIFQESFLNEGDRLADGSLLMIPPVDLYETPHCYVLSAELPGVKGEDVHVEVKGAELSIRGERKVSVCCSDESYHRLEGIRGSFHRTFSLPEVLAADAVIKASLQDGVLQVELPKPTGGKNISIRSARDGH